VAGLLLLAVPGFAVGLVAGVLWREPELVVSHLFGGTREVAWDAGGRGAGSGDAPAPTGDVAAAPPGARSTGSKSGAPVPPPPSEATQPAALAAREPGAPVRLAVQVGAFGDAASAEKLAGSLRRKGFAAFVSPSTGEADARWRVRVGPFASREEAERAAARLKAAERLPTWVVEDGRS
jgi:cell division septation protein DedD